MKISKIFADIGTFYDIPTGIILTKNREIALVFSAISAISAISGRRYRPPVYGIIFKTQL
jgi:hypothetical protein